jgi:hypothetical protein
MRLIGDAVNKVVYKVFSKQSPVLAEIIINWEKIVGLKFSQNNNPLKVTSVKEKGSKINILYISSNNSSASMEIAYQQEIIIERIAIYLGYKAIHKIKFLVHG